MSPPSPLSPDPAAQRIEQRLTIVAIDGVVVGTRRGDRGAQPAHRRVAAQIRAGVAVIRQAEQHVRRLVPDRKSAVSGTSVSVSVDLACGRLVDKNRQKSGSNIIPAPRT